MLLCEYLRLYVFMHICIHIFHAHIYICASIDVCFNIPKSSHIHMLIYKHMDKHIHVYTYVLFLCVYVMIFQCLSMCTCACTFWCMYHTHANMCIIKNVKIYAHLNFFIWTKISFNTNLTYKTKLIKVFFFFFFWIVLHSEPCSESLEKIHLDEVKKQQNVQFWS